MRDYPTLHLDTIKVKEQLVVRKDIDVNEHVSFLTTSCSFTLIVSKCNVG
jgi:hypothetical protein